MITVCVLVVIDATGNLIVDQKGYDYENRLTKIEQDSTTIAQFTYDALGRRIEKDDDIGNAVTTYYYDGWRVLTEFEAPDVGATVERDFVWGNYLDEALVMVVDNTTDYYFAHDHLFSPVALMDDSGTVVERYEYDAYGKLTRLDPDFTEWSGTPVGNPIFFTGQRLDELDSGDLELMYYKNRYYHPDMGRFVNRDPLLYRDGMNLYVYVQSRPIMFVDAYGLTSVADPSVEDPIQPDFTIPLNELNDDPSAPYIPKFDPNYDPFNEGVCCEYYNIGMRGDRIYGKSYQEKDNPYNLPPEKICDCRWLAHKVLKSAKKGPCCTCKIIFRKSKKLAQELGGFPIHLIPLIDQPHAGLTIDCEESNGGFDFEYDINPPSDRSKYILEIFTMADEKVEKGNKITIKGEYDEDIHRMLLGTISCKTAKRFYDEYSNKNNKVVYTTFIKNCHLDSYCFASKMINND